MTTLRDRAIVAMVDYCEASSGTPEERRMVVHSIFNRVAARGRWYSRPTPAGVALLRFQYSETNDDAMDNVNLERGANAPDDDPVMVDCLAAFDEVAAGAPDPTGGATHYHERRMSRFPRWADPTTGAVLTLTTENFCWYRNVA